MYVYFIRQAGTAFVKIGCSARPQQRFIELQIGSPQKLELIGLLPESIHREAVLHDRFSHLRFRGEWFREEGELAAFIASEVPRKSTGPARLPIEWEDDCRKVFEGLPYSRRAGNARQRSA